MMHGHDKDADTGDGKIQKIKTREHDKQYFIIIIIYIDKFIKYQ